MGSECGELLSDSTTIGASVWFVLFVFFYIYAGLAEDACSFTATSCLQTHLKEFTSVIFRIK